MRAHLANDCPMRIVQCSTPGCMDTVRAGALQDHKRLHCKAATRNAKLNKHIATKLTEECPACHERVPSRQMRIHAIEKCPMKMVNCPNNIHGCGERIKAAELEFHLRKRCEVRIDRAERASRHILRQRHVRCSACGYMVVLQNLLRHQRMKCPDRRVPCKNWEMSCPAMVRLSMMNDHLKVDRLLDPRSCLLFDGGRAYIALEEEDHKPPWTVEMWIWRPALIENTREKARIALKAYWKMQRAQEKLAGIEQRLRELEPLLVDASTRVSKEASREANEARNRLTDEMVVAATLHDDTKVDLVVSVVSLSHSLTSTTRAIGQIIAGNLSDGLERLALGSRPWYDAPHSLPPDNSKDQNSVRAVQGRTDEQVTTPISSSIPAAVFARGESFERTITPSSEIAADERPLPPDECRRNTLLHSEASPEETEGEIADELNAAEDKADKITKKQEVLEIIKEEEQLRREAAFWAKWTALSGPSLAQQLLTLAEETLPRLKDEVVATTGLASGALFGALNDENRRGEGSIATDGEGDVDNRSSTSTKRKKEDKRKEARNAKRKEKNEKQFGKNLEVRIADEVRRCGGVETLFGSGKALVKLEMGPSDRVGIKIAEGPRERWVHLSFVGDSGRILLPENGNTVGCLPEVNMDMPMREIGGREIACQCLVQEVRFWTAKRSRKELLQWMHRVLPSNAVQEGLLGYWTLEEGAGDYVHDVTEQMIRARKVGRKLTWCAPEAMVGASPTPSWRERNVCKVRLEMSRSTGVHSSLFLK